MSTTPPNELSPLKRALLALQDMRAQLDAAERARREPIAVVGIGCRLPGGISDPDGLWRLLRAGAEAVGEVPPERWDADAFYDPDPDAPGKIVTRRGGFVAAVDRFDAQFFGIAPREAQSMDPQQRLLLEVAWEALEHAGLAPDRLAGSRAGVFVGISNNEYFRLSLADVANIDAYLSTGNADSVAAGRIAYILGLHGPTIAVDTACSSSLVTVHLAVQSLRSGECDLALAGGVNLMLSPEVSINFSKANMLAPDGRCKTFDAAADGYVRGEGCALIALKRLSDAQRDGDRVLAVIRGSAVNHDGRSNGLTAPNGPAQQAVIRQALQNAGVAPAQVSYVEAHGTGTPLGDPIELIALGAVLGQERPPDQPLLVGSVKTNLGHLETAAGAAGLIKLVLMLQHGEVPAHLHLKNPSPHIPWERLPLRVPTAAQPWAVPEGARRIAGISSFGFSGTNAHLVLEEAPAPAALPEGPARPAHLLTLSARTPEALAQQAGRLRAQLAAHPEQPLGWLAASSTTARAHLPLRLALVASQPAHAAAALDAAARGEDAPGLLRGAASPYGPPEVVFLCTGQGAQYVGMGRELYASQPVFRAAVDQCAEVLLGELGADIRPVMFGADEGRRTKDEGARLGEQTHGADEGRRTKDEEALGLDQTTGAGDAGLRPSSSVLGLDEDASLGPSSPVGGPGAGDAGLGPSSLLDQTVYTQPALFVLGYALAQLWRSWGVEPAALVGHSVGEVLAAHLAGVFSLPDALRLIAARGRLMQERTLPGGMRSVSAAPEWVQAALAPFAGKLSLAAVNTPSSAVVAGEFAALDAFAAECAAQGVQTQPLAVSHAFHSPLMDPVLDPFEQISQTVKYQKPERTLISTLRGAVAGEEVQSAAYWREHARAPVLFAQGMQTLLDQGFRVFVELGPRPTLSGLGQRLAAERGLDDTLWLPSLRSSRPETVQLFESLAGLYVRGAVLDWAAFERPFPFRRLDLPTYPFQRQRFWLEGQARPADPAPAARAPLGAEHCYELAWLPQPRSTPAETATGEWLLIGEADGLAATLAERLTTLGGVCTRVGADALADPAGCAALLARLPDLRGVVHLCALDEQGHGAPESAAALLECQTRLCAGVQTLLQALAGAHSPARLWVVTRGAQAAAPEAPADPLQAPLWGLGRVAALEQPEHWGGLIDLATADGPQAAARLADELAAPDGEDQLALRDERLAARLVRRADAQPAKPAPRIRPDASYLITGGLGALGLQLATWLAERGARSIVLLSRRGRAALTTDQRPATEADRRTSAGDAGHRPSSSVLGPDGDAGHRPSSSVLGPDGDAGHRPSSSVLGPDGDAGLRPSSSVLGPDGDAGLRPSSPVLGPDGDAGLRPSSSVLGPGEGDSGLRPSSSVLGPVEAALQTLEARGVAVRVLAADVADEEQMATAWREIQALELPLRGVFHAAGVTHHQPLAQADPAILAEVLRPKAAGAWLLDRLSRGTELDFFVCFSSIAAVWGSRGLGAYAAANHTLDALAHARRATGLPALSINWGPWAGGGMMSAEEMRRLEQIGVGSFAPEQATALLRDLLALDTAQVVAAQVDWARFLAVYAARGRRPLLERLAAPEQPAAPAAPSQLLAHLASTPAGERLDLLRREVSALVARVLGFAPAQTIDPQQGLFNLGLDSLMSIELRNRLEQRVGLRLPATMAFDHPTVEALARHLAETLLPSEPAQAAPAETRPADEPIAVVGLACRFPGADSPEQFWELLRDGVDAIGPVPRERWDADAYYDPDPDAPGKIVTRSGGFLSQVDRFDAELFGIAPREAVSMDPQQRLLLEVSWEALERAGIAPERLQGSRTGVFVGITTSDYARLQLEQGDPARLDAYFATGNALNAAAGRLAYSLGLQGPCMSVDTACSSSLVAIHLACQSLRSGESSLALAGGVNVILWPDGMVALSRARMLAPDGRCKTFDASADGYGRGEGCGLVALKRLSDAQRDGDPVLALIHASAVNQDGASGGLTVPNGPAQQALIRRALAAAGLAPAAIDYVEAHGTGTSLGDPIEINALAAALGPGRAPERPLLVGSVKTNIGHLESAAGVAGLIKLVLSLQHGQIPPHLHFERPSPHIAWDDLPVEVPTAPRPWPADARPRLAGLSSFGFSGTNAHLIVGEAPAAPAQPQPAAPQPVPQVLALSARSRAALGALARRYEQALADGLSLADACLSAGVGRSHLAHRLALVAENAEQARARLAAFGAGAAPEGWSSGQSPTPPRVVFLCTGQGAQYLGMGRELYRTEPAFRAAVDQCAEVLLGELGSDIRPVMFGADEGRRTEDEQARLGEQTDGPGKPGADEGRTTRDERVTGIDQTTGAGDAGLRPSSSVLGPDGDAGLRPSSSVLGPDGDAGLRPSSSVLGPDGDAGLRPSSSVLGPDGDAGLRPSSSVLGPDGDAGLRPSSSVLGPDGDAGLRPSSSVLGPDGDAGLRPSSSVLGPDGDAGLRPSSSVLGPSSLLDQTVYTQPALFVLGYALAQLWRSWGVEPAALVGHSVGEVLAAHLAGVFSLPDALRLIAARGRLMQEHTRPGAMRSVSASPEWVQAALAPFAGRLSLAAVNGPSSTVVAGEFEALDAFAATCADHGVQTQPLAVSHAFHSPLMDPMLDPFEQIGQTVKYQKPERTLISTLRGAVAGEEVQTAAYWREHVRAPVLFAQGMQTLLDQGYRVFVELGPRPTLSGLGQRLAAERDLDDTLWLPSLRSSRPDPLQIRESLAGLYARGAALDWGALGRSGGGRRVALPTYPFQRQRFWFEPARLPRAGSPAARAGHPLIGRRLRLPMAREIRFEAEFAADTPPYLTDHRLYGTVVTPAASHIAMVLAAVRSVSGADGCVLEDLFFPQALVLSDSERRVVQLVLTPEGERRWSFQLVSAPEGDVDMPEAWSVHATGKASAQAPEAPASPLDAAARTAAQERCATVIPGGQFYATFWDAGYTLGPAFQWLGQIWRRDGETLARMHAPPLAEDPAAYQLYPGLIDSFFQLSSNCYRGRFSEITSGDSIYIPFRIARFAFYGRAGDQLWCHAQLRDQTGAADAGTPVDIRLCDAEGRAVAEVRGFESRRAGRDALVHGQARLRDWLYTLAWRPLAPVTAPPARSAWLILADAGGLGAALARRLAEQGLAARLVYADQAVALPPGAERIDPHDPAAPAALLVRLRQAAQAPDEIVYLWGLDAQGQAADGAELIELQRRGCAGALHLAQALAAAGPQGAPRLRLVTRGAQAVTPDTAQVEPAQAALWGLGRTLAQEHPELRCACIDLDPAAAADAVLEALLEELAAGADEDQVGLRGGRRYGARLVRLPAPAREAAGAPGERPALRLVSSAPGILDNLGLQPTARRAPGPGEVEIAVGAAGLNFRDVLNALGMYPGDPGPLGGECAGVVVAVGPGVGEFAPGDAVLALAHGSLGSYVTLHSNTVAHKPANLSDAEAATIPAAFLTAAYALERLAQLQPGETVLIHAAAGGVGMAAVQLAQQAGAEVYATAGSPEKRARLQALGVRHVFDSRTLDFSAQVRAASGGRGVDVVLNSLSGEFIPASLEALAPGGRFVEIGKIGIWDPAQVAAARPDVAYQIYALDALAYSDPAEVGAVLRELVARFGAGRLRPMPFRTFPLSEAAQAFRWMAQARHIGKIVLTQPERAGAAPVRPDGTYLISGGLGGLGLRTAQWLVERGARHLALLGRSAPAPAAQALIDGWAAGGVRVHTLALDVADPQRLARALAGLRAAGPPLRGVVHAAGLLDDGVLAQQSWARFARVLAPKAAGAWNLHLLTCDDPLDFFVLYSSTAALLGNPGQSNYAAANATLDALALDRRARGLPALSVNWGAWREVGMAARQSEREQRRWAEQGLAPIGPDEGLQALELLLAQPVAQAAVVPIQWARFARRFGQQVPALFTELAAPAPAQAEQAAAALARQLAETPAPRRRALLVGFVREQLLKVLALSPDHPVDTRQGLTDLGLDSLMAMELRNRLQQSVGGALSPTLTFDYPTVEALAEHLLNDVLAPGAAPEPAAAAPSVPAPPAQPADADESARLEQLSQDELVALLAEELAELDQRKTE